MADLYDPADRERGYVSVRNRAGVDRQMPLISLTVALATHATGRTQHLAQLSDIAAELKSFGKAMPGSVLVRERRSAAEAPAVTTAAHDPGRPR